MGFSCGIVSHAFDRSTYMAKAGLSLCLFLWMVLRINWIASVVLECGLKAYCVGDRIL